MFVLVTLGGNITESYVFLMFWHYFSIITSRFHAIQISHDRFEDQALINL